MTDRDEAIERLEKALMQTASAASLLLGEGPKIGGLVWKDKYFKNYAANMQEALKEADGALKAYHFTPKPTPSRLEAPKGDLLIGTAHYNYAIERWLCPIEDTESKSTVCFAVVFGRGEVGRLKVIAKAALIKSALEALSATPASTSQEN